MTIEQIKSLEIEAEGYAVNSVRKGYALVETSLVMDYVKDTYLHTAEKYLTRIEELEKALKELVADVRSKPNDTRYDTKLKAAEKIKNANH